MIGSWCLINNLTSFFIISTEEEKPETNTERCCRESGVTKKCRALCGCGGYDEMQAEMLYGICKSHDRHIERCQKSSCQGNLYDYNI